MMNTKYGCEQDEYFLLNLFQSKSFQYVTFPPECLIILWDTVFLTVCCSVLFYFAVFVLPYFSTSRAVVEYFHYNNTAIDYDSACDT